MPTGVYTRTKPGYWKGKRFTSIHKENMSKSLKNRKLTDLHKKHIGESHKGMTPALGKRWKLSDESKRKHSIALYKGDEAKSYTSIHRRMRQKFGDPKLCENCATTKAKKYEWANINHSYRIPIVRSDWLRLCTSCHRKHDKHG